MTRKLAIDADPGLADAIALVLAILDPAVDVVGVTATRGTVTARQAGRNIQTILQWLDPAKWPRLGTADALDDLPRPPRDPHFSHREAELNGPYGLADFEPALVDLHHPRESDRLLADLVRESPYEVTVLTLGPLTNIARAIERDREFLDRVAGLVSLGGVLQSPGDIAPLAEQNIVDDVAAASAVLGSSFAKTLVPLDVCRDAIFTYDMVQDLPWDENRRSHRLLKPLLTFSLRAHREVCGVEGTILPAVVALFATLAETAITTETLPLQIESTGTYTTGMTVVDRRQPPQWIPNVRLVSRVSTQQIWSYLHDRLRGPEPQQATET